jgi:hypothetical protein
MITYVRSFGDKYSIRGAGTIDQSLDIIFLYKTITLIRK